MNTGPNSTNTHGCKVTSTNRDGITIPQMYISASSDRTAGRAVESPV